MVFPERFTSFVGVGCDEPQHAKVGSVGNGESGNVDSGVS